MIVAPDNQTEDKFFQPDPFSPLFFLAICFYNDPSHPTRGCFMNTMDATVNGLRFSPDGAAQVLGNSKYAFLISQRASGNMFFDHDDDEPTEVREPEDDTEEDN